MIRCFSKWYLVKECVSTFKLQQWRVACSRSCCFLPFLLLCLCFCSLWGTFLLCCSPNSGMQQTQLAELMTLIRPYLFLFFSSTLIIHQQSAHLSHTALTYRWPFVLYLLNLRHMYSDSKGSRHWTTLTDKTLRALVLTICNHMMGFPSYLWSCFSDQQGEGQLWSLKILTSTPSLLPPHFSLWPPAVA